MLSLSAVEICHLYISVRGVSVYVKHQPILTQDRPVLDEASFQQLLAAAFVLQQQRDTVVPPDVQTNYSQTLAYIAETQNQIQTRQLDLPAATMLIAEQVEKITKAGGVAVGLRRRHGEEADGHRSEQRGSSHRPSRARCDSSSSESRCSRK